MIWYRIYEKAWESSSKQHNQDEDERCKREQESQRTDNRTNAPQRENNCCRIKDEEPKMRIPPSGRASCKAHRKPNRRYERHRDRREPEEPWPLC
jgi:hypothetical protein